MTTANTRPLSIAERKRNIEADAALDQMYSYFTREEMPRPIISELDARRAA